VLDAEIAAILRLGTTLHLSTHVDPLARAGLLEEGFDAVIVATGGGESPSSSLGLFPAGNLVLGPSPFVHAIADGSRVAREVHAFLTGEHLQERQTAVLVPAEVRERVRPRSRPGGAAVRPPVVDLPAAGGEVHSIETSLPEADALAEAGRCVDCHRSAVIDAARCTACGICVDICPEDALSVVPESRVAFEGEAPSAHGLSVLLKDADRCTRCGWCSPACPERAITVQVLEAARDVLPGEIQE
jgi:ferredoxin